MRERRRKAAKKTEGSRGALSSYRLEDQIGHLLRRAHQRHVAVFQRIFGEEGPTPTQFATLYRLQERGTLSQNELGRLTAMDPATIKGVVTRLQVRGLVDRKPDATDQRRIRLSLSESGRAKMSDLIVKAQRVSAATLEPLEPHEAECLVALLKRIS